MRKQAKKKGTIKGAKKSAKKGDPKKGKSKSPKKKPPHDTNSGDVKKTGKTGKKGVVPFSHGPPGSRDDPPVPRGTPTAGKEGGEQATYSNPKFAKLNEMAEQIPKDIRARCLAPAYTKVIEEELDDLTTESLEDEIDADVDALIEAAKACQRNTQFTLPDEPLLPTPSEQDGGSGGEDDHHSQAMATL
jgi:hypothetical protein